MRPVPDAYRSFRELETAEREGEAWALDHADRGSRILVMAPHGGWIEPLTTELARAVAGPDLSFYSFQGVQEEGNQRLHLTSHRFDEPVGLEAASRADQVLAIHGERTRDRAFVMVGGRCDRLRRDLTRSLTEEGFSVREPRPGLDGRHGKNICNRGRLGRGGQLEISEGLRSRFRMEPELQGRFVRAVRQVLLSLEGHLNSEHP